MKIAATISRVLLGLVFAVFGLNHFVGFIPHPEMAGAALDYMSGITATGYFWPFLRTLELLCGLALIFRFYPTLALFILTPITLNIFLFHIFLEPVNIPMAAIMLLLNGFLVYWYWDYYKLIFTRSPLGLRESSKSISTKKA
ncbi:DoxX family protein [uncultured Aquimarina sp.]|uniref:DoxX family protein n=1 Tax=uncultured Aquimarina sp. TaxID=575652 RepID=UPI00262F11BE|nr:DoxX family protein [uncultured Aquimarina sp.]